MADKDSLYARIKPYDAEQDHLVRTYMYKGNKFEGERGWYPVDPALGAELKELHQVPGNKKTPKLFDVVTKAEADQIDAEEGVTKGRRTASEAARLSTLTTATVPLKDGAQARGEERRVGGNSREEDERRANGLRQAEDDLRERKRFLDAQEDRLNEKLRQLDQRMAALEGGAPVKPAATAPAVEEKPTEATPPPAPAPSALGRITGPDMKAFDEADDEDPEDDEPEAPTKEGEKTEGKGEKQGRTRGAKK